VVNAKEIILNSDEMTEMELTKIHPHITASHKSHFEIDWATEHSDDEIWIGGQQEFTVSPPSLCTTIDGSWSDCRSFTSSFSLASTLDDTKHTEYLTNHTRSNADDANYQPIATRSSLPIKIDPSRKTMRAEFELIHANRNRAVGEAEHAEYILDSYDDDNETLLGDDIENEAPTSICLGFTKQTPVIADPPSLLTRMLLHRPLASVSVANETQWPAHPSIRLVENDCLSQSLKQQVLWENMMNGVIKRSKNNLADTATNLPTDCLHAFTGFW
jgi:hypothetical protein